MAKPRNTTASTTRRCAIYTRKSTEEGLEQAFNSLDAQREACSAYILSHRHEGWTEHAELYDDGGYSGGSMDRPGLRQLLADVEAGRVDVIVVYKVDRLTRSLADFAKIVEILDRAGASFVSVTQAFNTTNSMGRLTLNVLLSFAQFEREVTGERIRDKIAASKARGMWMGGNVPLGYRVVERKLLVDEQHAATVRHIFERYVALGSTTALSIELDREGVRSLTRTLSDGRIYGGKPLTRGALVHLLTNRIYLGEICHKGTAYSGEHEPIIGRDLWDTVQAKLSDHRRDRRSGAGASQPSLLIGMMVDGLGRPMTLSHARKGSTRYRYYISRQEPGDPRSTEKAWRIPASEIEPLVVRELCRFAETGLREAVIAAAPSARQLELFDQRARAFAQGLAGMPTAAQRERLQALALTIELAENRITIRSDASAWLSQTGVELPLDIPSIELVIPATLRRGGAGLRLVFKPNSISAPIRRDDKLVGLITKAHRANDMLLTNTAPAEADRDHLTRVARLAYLAPDIITAIIEGRQPASLFARRLLRAGSLPLCWQEQRRLFGFV